jgi:signal transduction histidine kinase/HAMP domain-containing protein
MATAAVWRISLRLHIVLAVLTAASAMGSALFLMYLARPYMVGHVPRNITALGGVLLLGAVVAGVLAAVVGLVFGMLTSRRIRELIRRTEALLKTDIPQAPRPAADELGALKQAFGRLTLSIDHFVRDSEILSRLPQGLLFMGPGGELAEYNTAAECILGISLEPYAQKVMWGQDGLFPAGPENGRFKDLCQQATGTADPVSAGEVHIRLGQAFLPAGTQESRLLEVTLRRWQGGTDAGALIMFQDASEKQRIREQIRKADELAFLGGLAAQFSHQVRTPLTVVRGLLELLRDDSPPTEDRQQYFDRIMRGLHRLDHLAASLLSLAHSTPNAQEAIHLPRLLDDILTLTDAAKPEAIHIKADYAPSLPAVMGDPHLLAEALTNLIQNALEATTPGGQVTIQARPAVVPSNQRGEGQGEGGTSIHPSVSGNSQGVEILIQNCGSGIPEELRERIFEPFFSSKRRGTGLGLTIARRLIESHGGRISVESDGSSWTRFIVDLPS